MFNRLEIKRNYLKVLWLAHIPVCRQKNTADIEVRRAYIMLKQLLAATLCTHRLDLRCWQN